MLVMAIVIDPLSRNGLLPSVAVHRRRPSGGAGGVASTIACRRTSHRVSCLVLPWLVFNFYFSRLGSDSDTPRSARPTPDPAFTIAYNVSNYTYSGLRVDQLRVAGDVGYKPFKGVRTSARSGRVEVRW